MPSLRYAIVVTPEIVQALKEVSEETRIASSTLVRDAVLAMLATHGKSIDVRIKPGGKRTKQAV